MGVGWPRSDWCLNVWKFRAFSLIQWIFWKIVDTHPEGKWIILASNQSCFQIRWVSRDAYTYIPGFAKVMLHSIQWSENDTVWGPGGGQTLFSFWNVLFCVHMCILVDVSALSGHHALQARPEGCTLAFEPLRDTVDGHLADFQVLGDIRLGVMRAELRGYLYSLGLHFDTTSKRGLTGYGNMSLKSKTFHSFH